ncbi:MAG: flavin monoamine oxidase family protein [Chitinophagales bacterium]
MSSKNGRTKLFTVIQKCFTAAQKCRNENIAAEEYLESEKEKYLSRRKFLEQAGKLSAITALAGTAMLTESFAYKNKDVKIVIVGAGIAGLSAAYHLKKAGYSPIIYEASNRPGGRMFTAQNLFFEGSWTELGAEFIDTEHKHIWKYIKEFELETIDILSESEQQLIPLTFYFDGKHYSEKEIIEAFLPIVQKISLDQKKLSEEIYYNQHSAFDAEMDKLSIEAYLEKIGATGLIKEVIEIAFITEYGEDIGNQSALNFLTVIGTDTTSFKYYGESDERYKVKGGNQKITDALAKKLEGEIFFDHTLTALKKPASTKIELTFTQQNGSVKTKEADRVLLTLPFTILKDIEMSLEMSNEKMHCIQNIGYGKNVKLFAGFNSKPWRFQDYTGAVFTSNGIQSGWDNTQLQENEKSGFTIFTGGALSNQLGTHDPAYHITKMLPLVDEIYPGSSGFFNGISQRMHWPTYKFAKASYLSLKPGQYTTMSGLIGEPVGNIFFAGEHCSYHYQGFMNGAAETGIHAAKKIMRSL